MRSMQYSVLYPKFVEVALGDRQDAQGPTEGSSDKGVKHAKPERTGDAVGADTCIGRLDPPSACSGDA